MIKVRFLASPTGKYKLGYNEGEVANIPKALAEEIVDNGDGEIVAKRVVKKPAQPKTETTKKG